MEEFHGRGAVRAAASLRKEEKLGGSSGMDTWPSQSGTSPVIFQEEQQDVIQHRCLCNCGTERISAQCPMASPCHPCNAAKSLHTGKGKVGIHVIHSTKSIVSHPHSPVSHPQIFIQGMQFLLKTNFPWSGKQTVNLKPLYFQGWCSRSHPEMFLFLPEVIMSPTYKSVCQTHIIFQAFSFQLLQFQKQ